jgi:hypothetical protein
MALPEFHNQIKTGVGVDSANQQEPGVVSYELPGRSRSPTVLLRQSKKCSQGD